MKPEDLVQRPGIRLHGSRSHRMPESARLAAVATIRRALAACGQGPAQASVTANSPTPTPEETP